ncbi:dynein light chain roadblock-type 2 [Bactrocera oleae]|uniref:dynein light chain roadblock-type 2 n=1 Tax=Bactrocera oleae TaxID=104688 RepID=UPI0006B7D455|nr:dynein light chain roadblock-type 2 isoform X1 [Bactrocera oleae]XP_036231494.1 dynein light chain roadblock-type 2 isoform X1 [Bactrocera oleae]XP_036231495.1 dynein light chain roadblock-type 2 isoform X1 [Bactrocera oleae]
MNLIIILCKEKKMQADQQQSKRTRSYVEEVFRLIEEKPDIVDIIILNKNGNPVKTTMEKQMAIEFVGLYEILKEKVQLGLQKIDPKDELLMLRVRTKANEVLITPDGKITVMVIQNAQDRIQL